MWRGDCWDDSDELRQKYKLVDIGPAAREYENGQGSECHTLKEVAQLLNSRSEKRVSEQPFCGWHQQGSKGWPGSPKASAKNYVSEPAQKSDNRGRESEAVSIKRALTVINCGC